MLRSQWIPKDAVGDHPAIGQEDIRAELNRHHFIIHLHNDAPDPTPNTFTYFFMVAENFHIVTHFKSVLRYGRFHECKLRPARSRLNRPALNIRGDSPLHHHGRNRRRPRRLGSRLWLLTHHRICPRGRFCLFDGFTWRWLCDGSRMTRRR